MRRLSLRCTGGAVVALGTGAACSHPLASPPATVLPWHWSFEPWVLVCLALSLGLYLVGLARLWRHAGSGRGVARTSALAFMVGWAGLVLALVSPLDGWGGSLFSAHMLQHELLMVVVAPLLVMGRPLGVWAWGLPPAARRGAAAALHHPLWRRPWRVLSSVLAAWLLHAAVLWAWHWPFFFEAALHSNTVHSWQHISFLFSALLFWWTALGRPARGIEGPALLSLFTTMLHTSALGALLTLSPLVWYPHYLQAAAAVGWDALEDQQLGGLVMWVPAGLSYLIAGLAMAQRWIGRHPDGTSPWADRPPPVASGSRSQ